jgi:hypothetical protein
MERKGFFTPEQEAKLDEFIKLEGIYEAMDGTAIKLTDNIVLNKLKEKLSEKNPELTATVLAIIDEVFANL